MDPARSARKLEVLIADDESVHCKVLATYLEVSGCRVQTASSGDEVIRILQERGDSLDVLVLDVWMPGPPSRELLSAIRRLSPGTAVLFVSAREPGDLGAEPIIAPFNFLSKPFRRSDLQQAVYSAYRDRHLRGGRSVAESLEPKSVCYAGDRS